MEYCINEFIKKEDINYEDFIDKVHENNLQKLKYLAEQTPFVLHFVNEQMLF
jgi:hypothetical protein